MAAHIKRAAATIPLHEISLPAVVGISIGGAVAFGLLVLAGLVVILQWRHGRSIDNIARNAVTRRSSASLRNVVSTRHSQLPGVHRTFDKRSSWAHLSSNENLRETSRKKPHFTWWPGFLYRLVVPVLALRPETRRKRTFAEMDESTRLSTVYESYQINPESGQDGDDGFRAVSQHYKADMEKSHPSPELVALGSAPNVHDSHTHTLAIPKPVRFSLFPSPYSALQNKVRPLSLPTFLEPEAEGAALAPPVHKLRHSRSRSFGCINPDLFSQTQPSQSLSTLKIAERRTIRKVSAESALTMVPTNLATLHTYDIHQLGDTRLTTEHRVPRVARVRQIARNPPALTGDEYGVATSTNAKLRTSPNRSISRILAIVGEDPSQAFKFKELPLVPTLVVAAIPTPIDTKGKELDSNIREEDKSHVPSDANSNPFVWSHTQNNFATKPSAMKGSPNARKNHKRQNCVRIEVNATVLGPPSRTHSSSRISAIIEESPETLSAKSSKGSNVTPRSTLLETLSSAKPPSASSFNPDVKLEHSSTRTSFKPSACDVVRFATSLNERPLSLTAKSNAQSGAQEPSTRALTIMSSLPTAKVSTLRMSEKSPSPKPRALRHRRSASSSTLHIDPEDLIVESPRSSLLIEDSDGTVFASTQSSPAINNSRLTTMVSATSRQQEFEWPTIQLQSSPPRTSAELETWPDTSCIPSPLIFTPKSPTVTVFPTTLNLASKSGPTTKLSQPLSFPASATWSSPPTTALAKRPTHPLDSKPDFSPSRSSIPRPTKQLPRSPPRVNGPRAAPAQDLRKSVKSLRAMGSDATLNETREQKRYRYMGREASPDLWRNGENSNGNSPRESVVSLGTSVWDEGEAFWQQENRGVVNKESPLGARTKRMKAQGGVPGLGTMR